MTVSVERDESTMSSYATYRTLWCTDQFQQRHWKLQKTPQRRSPQGCSKNAMNLWRKRILCIKNNLLLRHAIQAILRKIVFLLTARTSSTQYEVVKPAMVAKAWQHQTGTLAKFTGQDFYQKKCTAHQERWTTFLRVPLHHYIETCQIGSAGICLYGFWSYSGIETPQTVGNVLGPCGFPPEHCQTTAQLGSRRLCAVSKNQTSEVNGQ